MLYFTADIICFNEIPTYNIHILGLLGPNLNVPEPKNIALPKYMIIFSIQN